MSANRFVLKGPGVEIIYMIGADPSLPALIYKAGASVKQFKPDEIDTESTGLGRMVSVGLRITIDASRERFGFFLPTVDVPYGRAVDFHTVGVYETFAGPTAIPHRAPTWWSVDMRGTAQTVMVPLAESAVA